ncbi:hypothetical protein K2X05_00380 [bacterium]|nr:hypothetical protein [bacterium]
MASELRRGFQPAYVELYKKYKMTHELAEDAKNFKSTNRNIPFLIQKIKSAPNEKLPQVKLSKGILYFVTAEKTYVFSHVRKSEFLFDGKLVDISKDLSKDPLFATAVSHWLIPSAEAVAFVPILFWAGLLLVVSAAGYCSNENIEKAFKKAAEVTGVKDFSAKWVTAPSKFNQYFNQVAPEIRVSCEGVAFADESMRTSNYDFAGFFAKYCADLKPGYRQTTSIMAGQGLNESVAEKFYGNADEQQKMVIRAIAEDHTYMKDCIEARGRLPSAGTEPETKDTAR